VIGKVSSTQTGIRLRVIQLVKERRKTWAVRIWSFFLKRKNSRVKQNNFIDAKGEDTYNGYNVSLRVYLLFFGTTDHDERTRASFGCFTAYYC